MTDIAEDDQWVWMDGSPVTLDPLWRGNHPDGGTEENCGEYVENHGFHDKKCENDKRIINTRCITCKFPKFRMNTSAKDVSD